MGATQCENNSLYESDPNPNIVSLKLKLLGTQWDLLAQRADSELKGPYKKILLIARTHRTVLPFL
jgi:hypothetical protein